MGSRIRFTMAKQVFETFPELHEKVSSPEGDVSPQDYTLEILEGEDPFFGNHLFRTHLAETGGGLVGNKVC